jgi:hypothetical protein
MSDLDLRLAALSPEKRALFERMLKKQGRPGGRRAAQPGRDRRCRR